MRRKTFPVAWQKHLGFASSRQRHIEQRDFLLDDKLKQCVERAHDAVHVLSIELHYLSCPGVCDLEKWTG